MSERLYFDWNSTAPLRAEARAALEGALDVTATPSSVHGEGRAARALVEKARTQVAALVGAEAKNVTFTSGATETNMLVLTPALAVGGREMRCDRLFVSAIEHSSVLCGGRFPLEQVEQVPVAANGAVDIGALTHAIARAERPLVSVMQANNETGVIQPIRELAEVVHAADGVLHVDAVQGAGRIDCDIQALGADLMTISSHKLGGPQGAGALVRRGDIQVLQPMLKGGGQERGQRAGTENAAAIAGFGAACAAAQGARQGDVARMAVLHDRLETGIVEISPDAVIFGATAVRLPNTTMFAVPGIRAETAVIAFDLNGIAISAGSACSSGKVQSSHVLAAMGIEPSLARGAIRISLGWSTTEAEVEQFLITWRKLSESLAKERHELAA